MGVIAWWIEREDELFGKAKGYVYSIRRGRDEWRREG
jgi:hypothetical protein